MGTCNMPPMEKRRLGSHGPEVSVVGLGGNNFGRPGSATEGLDGTVAVIDAALDVGVTCIDTAEMYGGGLSETLIGEAIRGRRGDVVIATKFGHADFPMPELATFPTGSREYVRGALEASLRRLGTDYIDLWQMHTPDPRTPIEETAGALDELVAEGTVLAYGLSNADAAQVRHAASVGSWVSAQDAYSLLQRDAERELLPAVRELGMGFLPYYPLFNGLLTGKFRRGEAPPDTRLARQKPELLETAPWDALEAYERFCAERGITMLEATFGWTLAQDAIVCVIAGATRPEQVSSNAAAAQWVPDADALRQIDVIFPGPAPDGAAG